MPELASDAVLLGAVGSPEFDRSRRLNGLKQDSYSSGARSSYANLRPAISYEAMQQRSPLRPENRPRRKYLIVRELWADLFR